MKRWMVLVTVLSLILLIILPACGGDKGEKNSSLTPIQEVTAYPTAMIDSTANPTANNEPVKIGAIYPRSGPFAAAGLLYDPIVSLVEWQVKNRGGILGGREVKFIQGDDRGLVAEAAGQAKKLILDEKVTILTFGGVSGASFAAVADVAEELRVPYIALAALEDVADKKYCADTMSTRSALGSNFSHVEFLKPTRVAYLIPDLKETRAYFDGSEGMVGLDEQMKTAGMKIVYKDYYGADTVDFSSYITKIKYSNPDFFWLSANNPGNAIAMLKQIMELGGPGNANIYFSTTLPVSIIKRPEAVGVYFSAQWIPGSNDPGMKAFEDGFMQKYGKLPDTQTALGYNCFWIAIKAIELAGTDNPEKVAQALRSGNLEWDGSFGHQRIGSDGGGIGRYPLAHIQEIGKVVQVLP